MENKDEDTSGKTNLNKEVSDWDLSENIEVAKPKSEKENSTELGPFGIEYVDPLVFHKSDDIPELRASAAKIPSFMTLEIKEPAPVKPAKRKYTEWIPGRKDYSNRGDFSKYGEEASTVKSFSSKLRFVFGMLIVSIPIILIILIVRFGLSLYK